LKVESNNPPFGAVDLDHTMTKRDDMDVAKEILAVNPYQRIIFFIFCLYHGNSWKYGKAVEASCRLMQKPFEPNVLVDTKTKRFTKAWRDYANIKQIKDLNPTHEQLREYLPKM
jgi:response regulator RpfG family c-di-GMP phosphodiesterase